MTAWVNVYHIQWKVIEKSNLETKATDRKHFEVNIITNFV